MKKIFIIRGANFYNKGAQAMLFITVSELRTRFKECEIIVCTYEKIDKNYNFKAMAVGGQDWNYLQGEINPVKYFIKKTLKTLLGRRDTLNALFKFKKLFSEATALIDISGYSLSSQREPDRTETYLSLISCCKKYNVPVFVMPQSIGPFDYNNDKTEEKLKCLLRYPVMIFPREDCGYNLLKKYHLNNVTKSYDLVLQNKTLDLKNIYNGNLLQNVFKLPSGNNVAIIPNARNFVYGSNKQNIINLYYNIIKLLRINEKNIYILRHSTDDISVCQELYNSLPEKTNVHLLLEDYNCIEFNSIISHFDFVIASRYHSIVHSYKNGIPALVLGWAEKYHELLVMFEQESFMFDVRCEIDEEKLLEAVNRMCRDYEKEHEQIVKLLPKYQNENCFDILTDYFKTDKGA